MDLSLSSDTVTTVIATIAPGYFAVQSYAAVNAKPEKNFSRTLVESIVFGFLIAGLYKVCLYLLAGTGDVNLLRLRHFLPLLILSPLLGIFFGIIVDAKPVRTLRRKLRLPGPDDDYLRVLFKGLKTSSIVTVALKSGEIFSGTPEGWSTFSPNAPQRIYFNNIAWYRTRGKRQHWELRDGSLIVLVDDIAYIETDEQIAKDL